MIKTGFIIFGLVKPYIKKLKTNFKKLFSKWSTVLLSMYYLYFVPYFLEYPYHTVSG